MLPLFEGYMLPLMLASTRASSRVASGAVVKSPNRELSQFSKVKTPTKPLFEDKTSIGALATTQIGTKFARIVLILSEIMDNRLFPCLNG